MVRPALPDWRPLQAVQQAIADGETWLFAWALHSTVSYRHLSRDSGIPEHRLMEIDDGSPVTRSEFQALVSAWRADPKDVLVTMPPGALAE